jgi:Domain of unknown function (DUF4907)
MNKQIIILILSICVVGSCKNITSPHVSSAAITVPKNLSYKIIDAPHKTFGYDIYADGKLLIHQPHTPAMRGIDGFKSSERAIKVANLVIKKIEKGEMPPTVTTEELKKLDSL